MKERLARLIKNPSRIPVAALCRLAKISGTTIPWTVRLNTGGTMNVLLPETVSVSVAYDGDFEPDVTTMMQRVLIGERNPIFYDVGAHFGLRSIQAHAIREGRIYIVAFEPHPRTMAVLHQNVDQLRFRPGGGITCVQKAVGSREGSIAMTDFAAQYSGSNTLFNPRLPADVVAGQNQKRISVEMATIDKHVLRGGPTPTFMKFDIENGEYDALAGADRTIHYAHPTIIMEVGDDGRSDANSTRRCLKFLEGHGYGFYRLDIESGQLEGVCIDSFSGGRGMTIRTGQDNLLCVHERSTPRLRG